MGSKNKVTFMSSYFIVNGPIYLIVKINLSGPFRDS